MENVEADSENITDMTEKKHGWICSNWVFLLLVIFIFILIGVSACLIFYIKHYIPNAFSPIFYNVSNELNSNFYTPQMNARQAMGNLGDFFGGTLGTIFSFFSLVLLIITVYISTKAQKISEEALSATKEQIKLNTEELENSNQALYRSNEVQDEISKTQRLQQLDSYCSMALSQLSRIIEKTYLGRFQAPEKGVEEFFGKTLDIQFMEVGAFELEKNNYYFFSGYECFINIINYVREFEKTDNFRRSYYYNLVKNIIPNELKVIFIIFSYLNEKHDAYKKIIEDTEVFNNENIYINIDKSSIRNKFLEVLNEKIEPIGSLIIIAEPA